MSRNVTLKGLTVDSIATGTFRTTLPELYGLEHIVENDAWHTKQTVFDHSLAAIEAFDRYILNEPKLTKVLSRLYGHHTRHELLRLGILLHDIGKLSAFYVESSGKTHAPSHSSVGRWVVLPMLQRLELDTRESHFVADLIGDHILACDLLELTVKTGKHEYIELLKAQRPDNWRELMLVVYGDTIGCKVSPSIAQEAEDRILLIKDQLQ